VAVAERLQTSPHHNFLHHGGGSSLSQEAEWPVILLESWTKAIITLVLILPGSAVFHIFAVEQLTAESTIVTQPALLFPLLTLFDRDILLSIIFRPFQSISAATDTCV